MNNIADGEAGRGVYAYIPKASMRAYYSANGENCYRLTMQGGHLFALHQSPALLIAFIRAQLQKNKDQIPGYKMPTVNANNVQRYGRLIEQFIDQQHPEVHAYTIPHRGPGIPTGVQVVIRDLSVFDIAPVQR